MTLTSFLKSIIYFTLAIIPALAWYVSESTFFPFITGKNFAFRTIIEISFIAWVILATYDASYRPKKSLVFYSYSAFLAVLFIANLFGDNPYLSFFGNYERMEGWFTHLHLFAYFTILYSVYKVEKDWIGVLGWFMVASIAVASQALLQLFGQKDFFLIRVLGDTGNKIAAFLNIPYPTSMGNALRLDSTLGNSEYYGVYTLLFIFISLMLAVKMNKWSIKNSGTNKRGEILSFIMVFVSAFVVLSERILLVIANIISVNAPMLAEYIALLSQFLWYVGVLMLIYFGYNFVKKLSEGVISSVPLALFAILNVILLAFTQQRGSYLGLIVAVLVSILVFVLSEESRKKYKKLTKYIIIALSTIVLIVTCLVIFKDSAIVKNSVIAQRISTIKLTNIIVHPIDSYEKIANESVYYPELVSHFGEATIVSRFLNMKMSVDGVNDNLKEFLLGHGQENYIKVFSENFDPRMYAQESWFDRAHNVFMDWLVAGGLLGLLAYLALYLTPTYMMWIGRGSKNISLADKVLLTGALAGYFVHNIFVFDSLTSYIIFVAILAYVASVTRVHENSTKVKEVNKVLKYFIILVGILISIYLFLYTVLFPLMTNLDIISALKNSPTSYSNLTSSTNANIKYFTSAINRNSFGKLEANEQMLQKVSNLANLDLSQMKAEDRIVAEKAINDFKLFAGNSFENQIASNATARNTSFYGMYLRIIGDYNKSIFMLEKANLMSPNKQAISIEYAKILAGTGNIEQALEVAKKAYDSEPSFETAKSTYETLINLAESQKVTNLKEVIKK
jgi:hypothetical protein